jgi:hypothetical protein
MSPADLDARVQAAWASVQAAQTRRLHRQRLPAARRALAEAEPRLRACAPDVATVVAQALASLDPVARLAGLPDGDLWAFAREADALRGEGVPAHVIARAAIRAGRCKGPATAAAVQACAASLRKERQRYRRRP